MTDNPKQVTIMGIKATVPDDPKRFLKWDDDSAADDVDFILTMGGIDYGISLGDIFDPKDPLARVACEAAIVHFESLCRSIRAGILEGYEPGEVWTHEDLYRVCENDTDFKNAECDADLWLQILEKVKEA